MSCTRQNVVECRAVKPEVQPDVVCDEHPSSRGRKGSYSSKDTKVKVELIYSAQKIVP